MISLILGMALIGFLLWALLKYVPMVEPFKTIILIVVIVCIVLYLASVFGILNIPVPRVSN